MMGARSSFATRLILAGLALTLVLIGGVSAYLLVAQAAATTTAAGGDATNRVLVARQLLQNVTEPQVISSTSQAAANIAARLSGDPALGGSLANAISTDPPATGVGVDLFVLSPAGAVMTHAGSTPVAPQTLTLLHTVLSAYAGTASCALSSGTTTVSACGVENLDQLPSFDAVQPIYIPGTASGAGAKCLSPAGKICVGLVVEAATLVQELGRFSPVIGYPTIYVSLDGGGALVRYQDTSSGSNINIATTTGAVSSNLNSQMHAAAASSQPLSQEYAVNGVGQVASAYVPLVGPDGKTVAGFIGVEVPLSAFSGQTSTDIRNILEIAGTALVVVFAGVFAFVERFVRRPVLRLERGVRRIADGDYSTPIGIGSSDEFGRLATSVNLMREQINSYLNHVNASVGQLRQVSRALTTTTAGVDALREAVLQAAQAIAGGGDAGAAIFHWDGTNMTMTGELGRLPDAVLVNYDDIVELRGEEVIRRVVAYGAVCLVPMIYQHELSGALAVHTPVPLSDSDERALATLANNGAVALENTRLFEQERDTVQRLRQLESMKSDFLTTAQHELRTPILAIMGQIELITLAWQKFDDATKLDVIRDIEISTVLMGELVETIVEFSLLSAETVTLDIKPVPMAAAIEDALSDIGKHFKAGLPVTVIRNIDERAAVLADAKCFRQVLRAVLDNAVKFTPAGGTVTVSAGPRDHAMVRIDIRDTGRGISPGAIDHVFERFFQEDTSKTRSFGGLGMGLSLSQLLCQEHGATIEVTSSQPGGTRVAIVWPQALREDTVEAEEVEDSEGFHLRV